MAAVPWGGVEGGGRQDVETSGEGNAGPAVTALAAAAETPGPAGHLGQAPAGPAAGSAC